MDLSCDAMGLVATCGSTFPLRTVETSGPRRSTAMEMEHCAVPKPCFYYSTRYALPSSFETHQYYSNNSSSRLVIMPPYGEPDWASPGDTSNMAATQQSVTMPVSSSVVSGTNTNSADVRYVTCKKTSHQCRQETGAWHKNNNHKSVCPLIWTEQAQGSTGHIRSLCWSRRVWVCCLPVQVLSTGFSLVCCCVVFILLH